VSEAAASRLSTAGLTAAGGLTVAVAGAQLRDIHLAGHPVLDLIYVAVRDASWNTVPGQLLSSSTSRAGDRTVTELEVSHVAGHIAFGWRGVIETSPWLIRFTMNGIAASAFDANRIGLCLLHPQALKGTPVRIDGQDRVFPARIAPDPVFSGFTRMICGLAGGAEVDIRLSGEAFETEDHRNWSDPGWKTYCPPLAAPRPRHLAAGQRVTQSVELHARIRSPGLRPASAAGQTAQIRIGTGGVGVMPAIGLGASCLPAPGPAVRDAVRALRPAYLHVELEDGSSWVSRLDAAAAEAADLGVPLDIAVIAEPGRAAVLAARAASIVTRLGRVSVFSPALHHTERGTVWMLRDALGGTSPVGGGSRAHFAELNRGDFDIATWDFVTYGLSPQVHHRDDDSVLATAAAITDGLGQARALAAGLPVVTGPVTLRPRFNAAAGGPDPLSAADDDAPDTDGRQHTSLAAVYLAAAVSRLARAGAVTAYRTAGRRGVISGHGEPSPAAAVMAALTALAGTQLRTADTSDTTVIALAAGPAVLLTNLAGEPRQVRIDGFTARAADVLAASSALTEAVDPTRPVLPPRSVVLLSAAATAQAGAVA
jgi:hypothetical protein